MPPPPRQRTLSLHDRVAHAYYEYGRFCSAHPLACLCISLISTLFLSYPALSRIRLPVSSPMDVHWTTHVDVSGGGGGDSVPDWLLLAPAVYIQQIVIRGSVHPWSSFNLTSEQAVRGPLSRAFPVYEKVRSLDDFESFCLHVNSLRNNRLPSAQCLLLSPTLIWNNDKNVFLQDDDVVSSIFSVPCLSSFCERDVFLGMPTSITGIKPIYQTNRKRTIDYAITVFFHQYNESSIKELRDSLYSSFECLHSSAADESTFVHVFYRPRKYFTNYFPLAFTYVVLMLYLYFSVSKFEMVSSRLGLAIAATFTIIATLLVATGISTYLDLYPSLWGAEVLPYLALILGLENILCITRAVVYTPPSLDVSARISHGLSREGYTLTKYFLLEVIFVAVGFVTNAHEVQLFCQFGFIALIADFYMQMFFYVPCLCLDLHRLGTEEKRRFSLMLFSTHIPQLKNYPPVSCPMKLIWPTLFERERRRRVQRTLSDSLLEDRQLDEPSQQSQQAKGHRRSASTVPKDMTPEQEGPVISAASHRLRILSFVTRTRVFQRSLMVLFALWTIWLGFIVHRQWPSENTNSSEASTRFGVSHRLLETAPLEWGEWSRRTFKWWPVLFGEYNISLSGQYVTYLPPIVIKETIPPWDRDLIHKVKNKLDVDAEFPGAQEGPEALKSRIYWLERELRVYMAVCCVFVLASVCFFVSYVCIWGGGKQASSLSQGGISKESARKSGKQFVESVPIAFNGHRFPVEKVVPCGKDSLVSVCQEGKVLYWNIMTGEVRRPLSRIWCAPKPTTSKDSSTPDVHVPPSVWCIDAQKDIVVLGCGDGSVEIGCLERGRLLSVYLHSRQGVVHILLDDHNIYLTRVDGTMEKLVVEYSNTDHLRVSSVKELCRVRAHHKPISSLLLAPHSLITLSHDHTAKVWDRSCHLLYNLSAHSAPVTSACVDDSTNMLFSCCEEGVICSWDISRGELVRSCEDSAGMVVQLCTSPSYLLALSSDVHLTIWNKCDGTLLTRITSVSSQPSSPLLEHTCLVALSDSLALTAHNSVLSFWDLDYKALIKEVDAGGEVEGVVASSADSVIYWSSNNISRITAPSSRLK